MTRGRSFAALTAFLSLSQVVPASGADLGPLPADGTAHRNAPVVVPFDIAALKANWRKRIEAIKANGLLPIIDIESSFNSDRLNLRRLAQSMDEFGVALIAYSADARDKLWSDAAAQIVHVDPWRFIPTTNGGNHSAWTQAPEEFLAETKRQAVADRYPLMGEFEFRHYPSPRQLRRGEMHRDVNIPINGPSGHDLFSFAEETGKTSCPSTLAGCAAFSTICPREFGKSSPTGRRGSCC